MIENERTTPRYWNRPIRNRDYRGHLFYSHGEYNNDQNGMEPDETIIEVLEESHMQNTPGIENSGVFFY